MKRLSFFARIALYSLLFVPLTAAIPASAQSAPSVSLNSNQQTIFVYYSDFDELGLDFTITTPSSDTLKALTVGRQGTAREDFEYWGAILYADRGEPGFQGWGYDQKLADGTYSGGMWVFDGLNEPLDSGSQRFFVAFETAFSLYDKTLQLILLPGQDDGDKAYEPGELGIFLSSGPVSVVPSPAYSHTISFKSTKINALPPKAYIANVSVLQEDPTIFVNIPHTTPVAFSGEARDRNGNAVADVKLIVNGALIQAEGLQNGFSTWRAVYTPTEPYETASVRVQASDGSLVFTSEPYYVVFDGRQASAAKSTIIAEPDVMIAGSSTTIEVVLRAEDGSVITGREVSFQPLRAGDTVSHAKVVTDETGSAQVVFESAAIGFAQVDVVVNGLKVGSAGIMVTEEDTAGPPLPQPDETGALIKGSGPAVYYVGSDGKRHVFENLRVYLSWGYDEQFLQVQTISDQYLASFPLGTPVPYRPGTLVKVPSMPEVYVVDIGQVLRHVTSEALASELFGSTWNKQVKDLAESLLFTYQFGSPVDALSDLDMARIDNPLLTIDDEL